ncbi:hypothetical protein OIU78_005908 [Salix suchowensis]|nr:hypothetical protein OIU78_005908 [Salix suchowensis]
MSRDLLEKVTFLPCSSLREKLGDSVDGHHTVLPQDCHPSFAGNQPGMFCYELASECSLFLLTVLIIKTWIPDL